jgi:hypothetical protein
MRAGEARFVDEGSSTVDLLRWNERSLSVRRGVRNSAPTHVVTAAICVSREPRFGIADDPDVIAGLDVA